MVDASGPNQYAYTSGGQLWTEDGPFANDTVTNGYTNRKRVSLALQQPMGNWTNGFGYDGAGRLTNLTSQAGSFGYLYPAYPNAASSSRSVIPRISLPTLPNSSFITNIYDGLARVTSTRLITSGGTTLDAAGYAYNLGGQRTNKTEMGTRAVAYNYDNIGQLTGAAGSGGCGGGLARAGRQRLWLGSQLHAHGVWQCCD